MMNHLGLFEGIGGFSLAARWMGWETVAWCEINPFCQKVLKHHFPEAEPLTDIKQTDFTPYANRIDILTGGFPCQPYSTAGKRLGKEDDRHLWPEMLRAIREIKPVWVVGENVRGLISWNGGMVFDEVQADLENEGYEIIPFLLPACAVNAPHRRERVWFVAYSQSLRSNRAKEYENNNFKSRNQRRCNANNSGQVQKWNPVAYSQSNGDRRRLCNVEKTYGRFGKPEKHGKNESEFRDTSAEPNVTNTNSIKLQGGGNEEESQKTKRFSSSCDAWSTWRNWQNFPTQSPICGGNDGVSERLDGITFSKWRNESIKAYGNAIVPQVALQIFKAIEQYELLTLPPLSFERGLNKKKDERL